MKKIFLIIFFINTVFYAQKQYDIIVASDGTGNYKTLTEAVAALPMFNYRRLIIFIKNGTYNEKIRIEQDYITLKGEDREKTKIVYSQLREDWNKNMDAIGPGVINIYGDDIILENLTIENSQPQVGPHAFAIYGFGTRTIIYNCNVISKGGDTVSLWDYKTGMYYHANCYFEGAVDFVCPRGWCFIRDSKFYELKETASIWHAGSFDKNQKFVVVNSHFDGVKNFELGRHHYEAQFYLINCTFSKNMADKPIYRVTYKDDPSRNRQFIWGPRYYFYNCKGDSINYDWFKNNLNEAENAPAPHDINPDWTFNHQWDPESTSPVKLLSYQIQNNLLILHFAEPVTVIGKPIFQTTNGITFQFHSGGENDTIQLISDKNFSKDDLIGLKIINDAKIISSIASINERNAEFVF
ncbi:MAG: pectinesterase family protein [Melioribacteraceae bacterium]